MNRVASSVAARTEPRQVLSYTIVALVGMLAGILLGCVFSIGMKNASPATAEPPHPRSLEPKTP
jgi:hypothetical protein